MEKSKKCKHCGEMFYYGRVTAMYCSDACKQQAYLERRSNQFFNTLAAEDAEIVSYPEQPINEIEVNIPFEESICEPEVLNESESPASTKPEEPININSRKKVRPSIPEKQIRSAENLSNNGLFALLGAAAVGLLISGAIAASKSSGENVNLGETVVDRGDSSDKLDDEFHKKNETTEEKTDITQNLEDSMQHEVHNSPIPVEISPKTDNLLVKIPKLFNNLLEILHFRKRTNQETDKPTNLHQVYTDIYQSPLVDLKAATVKTKSVDPKVLNQLLQILQSVEKTKIEKELRDRNPVEPNNTLEKNILPSFPDGLSVNETNKSQTGNNLPSV